MSERYVLIFFENFIHNPTTHISTNLLGLRLILSQFSKLVYHTDCCKSFLSVFPRYLELPMSERLVLGVLGKFIQNPMTHVSTNLSGLRFIPSQFLKLVYRTDCRKSFLWELFHDISCCHSWKDVF